MAVGMFALTLSLHLQPAPLLCRAQARCMPPALCSPEKLEPPPNEERRTTGRRIGGAVRKDEQPENSSSPAPVGALGIILALFLLKGFLFPADSYQYTVSSFSTTTVRTDDGSGQPQYETRTESSFNTNIPGLAERVAEKGDGFLKADDFRVFPF